MGIWTKLFPVRELWKKGTASGSVQASLGGSVASGIRSTALGLTTTASGQNAVSEGENTLASGARSHAQGNGSQATGSTSHAKGKNTVASGFCSTTEGELSVASEDYAHAEGYQTLASASRSHAEGTGSQAYLSGMHSYASGNNSGRQGARIHASANMTRFAANLLLLNSARLTIPASRLWAFEIHLAIADPSDVAKGFYGVRRGILTRDGAGNTALVGAIQTIGTDIDSGVSPTIAISADNVNEALQIAATATSGFRATATVYIQDISLT